MIEANAPLWFFVFTLPICIWVAWNDMARMKIPNIAVLALLAVFMVVGVFVLPFGEYAQRYLHIIVIFVIGFIVTSVGLAGAGDSKFAAAMAPFIALSDLTHFLYLFAVVTVVAFITHRSMRRLARVRALVPDWESWHREKDFPMGLALASGLSIYLFLAARGAI